MVEYLTNKTLASPTLNRIIDSASGWFYTENNQVTSPHIYFKKINLSKEGWTRTKPTIISEFGGYSFRVEGHCFTSKEYGYKSFSNIEDFQKAVITLYESEVLPAFTNFHLNGCIYTQVSDIEDETNGFLTYDRQVNKFADEEKK